MQIYREHVWPYRSLDNFKFSKSTKITLDQLEEFAKVTNSTLSEVFGALRIIRNAYELGLLEIDNTSNDSPEIAFMKSFLLCSKKGAKKLVRRSGGIEALARKAVKLLQKE